MCGDNPQVCPLTCTHTHSNQNIFQELWTLSLVYLAGSNWACTGLSMDLLSLSLSLFHSLCWKRVQNCHLTWIGIHDHTMFQWTARPCWALKRYVIFVLELVGLGEKLGPCALTWLFPCLTYERGVDWQLVVYCRMSSWGSDNVLSSPFLLLIVHLLSVQV